LGRPTGGLGDTKAAEPIFQEALALNEKYGGKEAAWVAAANNGLGLSLHARGEHARGDEYQKKGLEIRRRLFGNDHQELSYSLNDIGSALLQRKQYADAEPYLRESMRIAEAHFPAGHFRLAVTQNLWGRCRAGQEAFVEAEEALMAANAAFCSGEIVHVEQATNNMTWLADLYESWDAAQPNTGKAQKAAQWREKLATLKATASANIALQDSSPG
jgi:tetratricopeptide (TPR) repeat protein